LLAIGAGYVPSEYAMFGKDMKKRPSLVEAAVATLKSAWTGQPFEYQGRTVRVTPTPLQKPHPTLLLGGNVPAAAERAGRIADGFSTLSPELHQIYRASALKHGRKPEEFVSASPSCVFVSEDPAKTWEVILPHVLYEINDYGAWAVAAGLQTGYSPARTLDEIKATGGYAVWTPEECIEMAGKFDQILFHPLVGGLDPAVGWKSLELVVSRVLPAIAG
jgi:alkanesulfonate monooxygenase SsuD/methylene tetrahydromethanopterin reductase-like flavin-dependent oxidoreductase (luciferase family)